LETDDSRGNQAVARITKLVTGGNNSFEIDYAIFFEDIKYMTISTRQERKRLVLKVFVILLA
jgi:hypothetical protein